MKTDTLNGYILIYKFVVYVFAIVAVTVCVICSAAEAQNRCEDRSHKQRCAAILDSPGSRDGSECAASSSRKIAQ